MTEEAPVPVEAVAVPAEAVADEIVAAVPPEGFHDAVEGPTEPERLLCPITHIMFRDPVFTVTGNTYERSAILEYWVNGGGVIRDPLTNGLIPTQLLIVNWDKRREIEMFLSEHPDYTPLGWPERRMLPAQTVRIRENRIVENQGRREYRVNVQLELKLEGWRGFAALFLGFLAGYSWWTGQSLRQVWKNFFQAAR
mmetsp:Transcript_53968/g.96629  ORF Transcript_53968/g.96629 Transcript_53968/m.96629 type:complete len:196 (-) Transcript_53968:22-609(-)